MGWGFDSCFIGHPLFLIIITIFTIRNGQSFLVMGNKTIVIVSLFLSLSLCANAQDSLDVKTKNSLRLECRMLKFNPIRSLFDEIPIYYEFPITDRKAIERKFGLIWPNPGLREFGDAIGLPRFNYLGLLGGSGIRNYSKKGNNCFSSYSFLIRLKVHTGGFWTGGMSGSNSYREVDFKQVLSIIHFQYDRGKLSINTKGKFINEVSVGFGCNFIIAVSRDIYDNELGSMEIGNLEFKYPCSGIYFNPTIHFTYKFGFKLKEKK
jgi:hypothetical protein